MMAFCVNHRLRVCFLFNHVIYIYVHIHLVGGLEYEFYGFPYVWNNHPN